MSVSEALSLTGGSFVLPGKQQQLGFQCARCRSYQVELQLHEDTDPAAQFRLTVRVVCGNCQNYIEMGLVANGTDN